MKRKKRTGFAKKTTTMLSLVMALTPQLAPFVKAATSPSTPASVQYLTIPTNKKVIIDIGDQYGFNVGSYNQSIVRITTGAGNVLTIDPLKEGSTFLRLSVYDHVNSVTQSFVVHVIDAGGDSRLDIGDIAKYLNAYTSSTVVGDINSMLTQIQTGLMPIPALSSLNLPPVVSSSSSIIGYSQGYDSYTASSFNLDYAFTDPNGDIVGYSLIQAPDPASGLSALVSGSYLQLSGSPTRPTSFSVRATDSQGLFADKTYTLNFAPQAVSQPPIVMNGSSAVVDLRDYFFDYEGDALTYYLNTYDSRITLYSNGLLHLYGSFAEDVQYEVRATDHHGFYVGATVSILAQASAPRPWESTSIIGYSQGYDSYTASSFNLDYAFTDPNGDIVGYSLIQAPDPASGLSALVSGSYLQLSGSPTRPTSFNVRATDSQGLFADKTYTLNFAPQAVSQPPIVMNGSSAVVDLRDYFFDYENDQLTFAFSSYDSRITLHSNGLLHLNGFFPSDIHLPVAATDNHGFYVNATVSILAQASAPIPWESTSIIGYSQGYDSYTASSFNLDYAFTDPNGDIVGYSLSQAPDPASGLSALVSGSYLQLSGSLTMPTFFSVRATDSQGLFADKTYTLNFAPQAVSQPPIVMNGSSAVVDLRDYFFDYEGDALTYHLNTYDSRITLHSNGLLHLYGSFAEDVQYEVRATDHHGFYVGATVSILGQALAPRPWESTSIIGYSQDYDRYTASSFYLDYAFIDPNEDIVGYSLIQAPDPASGLSALVSGSYLQISGSPTRPTSFSVRATDSQGLFADKTYTLNFAPQAVSQPPIVMNGSSAVVDLRDYFFDYEGDALTYHLNTYDSRITLHSNGLLHLYGSFAEDVQYEVRATDHHGFYVGATVSILGQALAPRPWESTSIIGYSQDYDRYTASSFYLDYAFTDPNEDIVGYSLIQAPDPASGLSAFISGSHLQISGSPTRPTSFSVRATDSQGLFADKTYTLNFAPQAVSQPPIVMNGSSAIVDLRDYFFDYEGDALTYYVDTYYDPRYTLHSNGLLHLNGNITSDLLLPVSATDHRGFSAHATVSILAQAFS
ncbi:hypothetical protein [Cohnella boryungensis]|uniref:Cadherin domain-containing protein n=1 Tax=Cohnella boryungensis TaxID=768479 RepID=A0ABV8S3V2_9BACL